jgi:hypothetical protein
MIATRHLARVAIALAAIAASAHGVRAAQLLPTPQDGDIRTVYWELQNRSEVFLTLELKSPDGKRAPLVTLSVHFPGKRPVARPSEIELRAYAGAFWAPRVALWLVLDDGAERIDLVPKGWWMGGLVTGAASDYLPATVSLETLKQITDATRVSGNALGFDFELSASQLEAIRAFHARVMRM